MNGMWETAHGAAGKYALVSELQFMTGPGALEAGVVKFDAFTVAAEDEKTIVSESPVKDAMRDGAPLTQTRYRDAVLWPGLPCR